MADHVVLYSTNTLLAHRIAERFYHDQHYVCCAPYFNSATVAPIRYAIPPSSTPGDIYFGFLEDVRRLDHHSAKIKANKVGILKGASIRKRAGEITGEEEKKIALIVDAAQVQDFQPLLYVIPYSLVAGLVEEVPIFERAHPLSEEYRIERLPRKCFDIILFK